MFERLAVFAQYALPKQALTGLVGRLAAARAGRLTTAFIHWFVAHYGVDMSQAQQPDIGQYLCFNDFFTRALHPGVRPLAQAGLTCPVDGTISQLGRIERDLLFQAKGHSYSTAALLAGKADWAACFQDGSFATIYLSPRDYHRVHMPCDGRLLHMMYVPGTLFSVNPSTARSVPGLFARNERVVCVFDTPLGRMALVLVGATIVGSMAVVWHGQVNPPRTGQLRHWDYSKHDIHLRQGQEMGRFQLGSTVVLLFEAHAVQFSADWTHARCVRMGEVMGERLPARAE